jgi:phage protein U
VPWKPFRYEGFSVSKGGGKILGSITESGNTYEVKEGDCMMGQFCVTRLTESMVEIEDLQLKRKQTFTFTRTQ